MKKISLFLLSSIVAISMTTSCDILELDPTDTFSNTAAWNSTATADSYTIGFYAAIRDASELYKTTGNGVGALSDSFSDILKQSAYYTFGAHNAALLEPDYFKSSDAGPLECWKAVYDRVKRHNEYLYNAPKDGAKFGDDFLLPRIAEVRFIRAFSYFQLARVYGGVVLRDEKGGIDSNKEKDKARMTEAETYNFIITELETAANDLPTKWTDPANFGRATKAAAYALQCRAALYAKKWDKAIEAAANVKTYGGELMPTYKEVFNTIPQNNKEVLLAVDFISDKFTHRFDRYFRPKGDNPTEVWCAATPTAELVDSYEMADGTKFDWNNSTHSAKPYENRDPRMKETILYNGADWNGRKIETFVGGADGFTEFTTSAATPASSTTTGYFIRKFLQESNTDFIAKGSSQFDIVLRYGETLLNLAEALAEQDYNKNKVAALAALNEVRTRQGSGMPELNAGDKSDFMAKLRHERMIELAVEGHRYWDLRRWKLCMSVINGQKAHAVKITKATGDGPLTYEHPDCDAGKTRYFKEAYYLLAIPKAERSSNKLCTNNDGWANN